MFELSLYIENFFKSRSGKVYPCGFTIKEGKKWLRNKTKAGYWDTRIRLLRIKGKTVLCISMPRMEEVTFNLETGIITKLDLDHSNINFSSDYKYKVKKENNESVTITPNFELSWNLLIINS